MTAARTKHATRGLAPALVAAGVLALGYADLARGGETLSALLIVAAYVVAVPWAILRTRARA